jgi:uncharacterized protein (UPF0332 family)
LKAEALKRRAVRSLAAARLLFDNGFPTEASSRAYYAMFDAARAALLDVQAPVEAEAARTHKGLISGFARHVVRPGFVPSEIARTFAQAQQARLVADYKDEQVSTSDALQVIEWAEAFVEALAKLP